MALTEEIKKILASDRPKSEKDRELAKLGLRQSDINTIWFNYRTAPPRTYETQEEFDAAVEDFRRRYPAAPEPTLIDTLNLILRKEIAHEIVRGEKKIEIREVSPFYTSRLYDKDVARFLDEHPEIEREYGLDFYDPLRIVEKIHFYSYSNTWHLDVECTYNTIITVTREEVEDIQKTYGSHEFDELLEELERDKVPDNIRPRFFIFAIGKILDEKL